jgi:hypothetical protein
LSNHISEIIVRGSSRGNFRISSAVLTPLEECLHFEGLQCQIVSQKQIRKKVQHGRTLDSSILRRCRTRTSKGRTGGSCCGACRYWHEAQFDRKPAFLPSPRPAYDVAQDSDTEAPILPELSLPR